MGYKITPIRRTVLGVIKAPSLYITEVLGMPKDKQYEEAIQIAKQKSGLGRFPSWEFV